MQMKAHIKVHLMFAPNNPLHRPLPPPTQNNRATNAYHVSLKLPTYN
jgi:hypothetical protein